MVVGQANPGAQLATTFNQGFTLGIGPEQLPATLLIQLLQFIPTGNVDTGQSALTPGCKHQLQRHLRRRNLCICHQ